MSVPFANPSEDTILDIVKEAAEGIKQTAPTTLNSTSRDVKIWLAAANWAGRDMRSRYVWPALNKRYPVTTTTATTYDLPTDFDRVVFDTFWQTSQYREMLGPLTAREWEAKKDGYPSTSPSMRYRLSSSKKLELLDTPTAGETFVFQFQSLNWILPTFEWAAGTTVVLGEYCHNDGNVYRAGGGGATGAVAPVHITGSASDGVISWTYCAYEKVVEDGAVPLMDKYILILGLQAFWLERNGFDFASILAQYNKEINKRIGGLSGARSFSMTETRATRSPFFGIRDFDIESDWSEV